MASSTWEGDKEAPVQADPAEPQTPARSSRRSKSSPSAPGKTKVQKLASRSSVGAPVGRVGGTHAAIQPEKQGLALGPWEDEGTEVGEPLLSRGAGREGVGHPRLDPSSEIGAESGLALHLLLPLRLRQMGSRPEAHDAGDVLCA